MEGHCARLHFPFLDTYGNFVNDCSSELVAIQAHLHIDLVTAKNNGDVLAHTLKIAMPVGHVLVCDAGRDVKHNDAALALDIVAIAETAELLLAGCVPNVEADCTEVCGECKRVNLDTESS
jgi:hypothetical protein